MIKTEINQLNYQHENPDHEEESCEFLADTISSSDETEGSSKCSTNKTDDNFENCQRVTPQRDITRTETLTFGY